jgi:hypothetical protein
MRARLAQPQGDQCPHPPRQTQFPDPLRHGGLRHAAISHVAIRLDHVGRPQRKQPLRLGRIGSLIGQRAAQGARGPALGRHARQHGLDRGVPLG